MRINALVAIMFLSAGNAFAGCPAGFESVTEGELFFGRNVATRFAVSDRDWDRFVEDEISTRFPRGFTIEDATGHWRGASGVIHERTKHVIVVITTQNDADSLESIRTAYKKRFHQQSVLLVEHATCASF